MSSVFIKIKTYPKKPLYIYIYTKVYILIVYMYLSRIIKSTKKNIKGYPRLFTLVLFILGSRGSD